jgi:hypothetical protein
MAEKRLICYCKAGLGICRVFKKSNAPIGQCPVPLFQDMSIACNNIDGEELRDVFSKSIASRTEPMHASSSLFGHIFVRQAAYFQDRFWIFVHLTPSLALVLLP